MNTFLIRNSCAPIPFLLGLLQFFIEVSHAANQKSLAPFVFSNAAQAQATWVPDSPDRSMLVSRPEGQQLLLLCPMSKSIDRIYWDHIRPMDLSGMTSFEFEFSCRSPASVEKITLYFKSGNGWYTASRPLTRMGWNRMLFPKERFSTEGKPGPWSNVSQIRLSISKAAGRDTVITPRRLDGCVDDVVLYQATSSMKHRSEKGTARRCTERLSRWLGELYIGHGVLTDETISKERLAKAKVVILPYNPTPGSRATSALKSFVGRGGRLLVFHASSSTVADLMQVRQGTLIETKKAGRWSAMKFKPDPEGLRPERIYQHVWNIVPVYPKSGSGFTLAHWENEKRQSSMEPAVVATDRGAWITQIFLEGDADSKQSLLVSILGRLAPDTVQAAAVSRIYNSARTLGCSGLDEVTYLIRRKVEGRPEVARRVEQVLKHLSQLDREMRQHFDAKQFAKSVQAGFQLRRNLQLAYAMSQEPAPAKEMRGFWDQNGTGLYSGDWARTCKLLSANGFNAIFPCMLWSGKVHYPSQVVEGSGTLERLGDQVHQCLVACRKNRMQCHLWKVCWKLENASETFKARMRKAGRMQMSRYGYVQNWLCPSHPENQKYELNAIREVASRYPVDGIHLDYIRFPDVNHCYCVQCRKGFTRVTGKAAGTWPDDVVKGGKRYAEFVRYRAHVITDFVAQARKELRKINPKMQLSAAVFPRFPESLPGIGQDYGNWLEQGLVDFVCPMNYTEDPQLYSEWLHKQMILPRARGRIISGIGLISNEAELSPAEAMQQIELGRRQGASGFLFFKLDHTVAERFLSLFRLGSPEASD